MYLKIRILIGIIYVALGFYIIFVYDSLYILDIKIIKTAGVVFMGYGLYRIVHTQYARLHENEIPSGGKHSDDL